MACGDDRRESTGKTEPEVVATWVLHEVDGDEARVLETEQLRAILEVIEWLNQ
ncbi:hypothetical protein [Glycomyces sp. NRRL B-16210]|uniref:hypothetical protein n=1 Tax=Glycomyces sp. NRRL B-16210 TaxID=1463821 RepID=UPI000A609D6F|nr:hypothetical protein [Glycomyces sp. NRRL B-16210]